MVPNDVTDYVDFQSSSDEHGSSGIYAPYLLLARFTPHQLSAGEGVAGRIAVKLGYRRKHASAQCILWPNELMPLPNVCMYYAVPM